MGVYNIPARLGIVGGIITHFKLHQYWSGSSLSLTIPSLVWGRFVVGVGELHVNSLVLMSFDKQGRFFSSYRIRGPGPLTSYLLGLCPGLCLCYP